MSLKCTTDSQVLTPFNPQGKSAGPKAAGTVFLPLGCVMKGRGQEA